MSYYGISVRFICRTKIDIMEKIVMTVRAIDWTKGNVGHVSSNYLQKI